ncbi:hypothetical protein SAMN05428995_103402 [Loktanella sp. DSM 29012]|uniref:hypothetical protein n=1 Tax=Loktanella sp. DSM 29012 TaxID=1881056 RepID=UPI0008ABD8C4|nr:hypothetical protein [Loktanella sp. DSM 29012]SEQ26453.1 hypothetical protein SAMN05428995_103402 [Loktanella sp. DSM 29012]
MNIQSSRPALVAIALAALAACSGGGGGGAVTGGAAAARALDPQVNDRLDFAEIAQVAEDVNDGYAAASITPKSLVPTAGRATYSGAVGGALSVPGRSTDVAGLMQLGVDFGANRVGGTLGNFVTRDGSEIDGVLTVNNGILNRTSNSQQVAIFGDVDGNLRSASGERIAVDARLRESGFKGRDVEFVGGKIQGDINVDGVRGAIDLDAQLER